MKKTILALMLSAVLPAIAQTAVTAPTAPTIPTMVTVSPNATAALSSATTNRVFIDQSGDNPNVNVTQEGSGNKQGSALRPIYLRGINQTIVTRQIGATNEINLEVVNPTVADSTQGVITGAKVTIQQIGDNNTVDAACGYGTLSNGTTSIAGGDGCKALDANWKFTGDSNNFQFRGKGTDIKSAIDIAGDSNTLRIDVLGNKHTQTIKVVGDTNTFNINQASTGTAGSSIWVDLAGNNNTMNISQTGSIDNVLNIKSVANSGTYNITQKN
jgi:hypothetical protein